MCEETEYGKKHSSTHGFVIHNGWSQWPRSDALTCLHRKGGASTIDYLMEPPSIMTKIKSSLSVRPTGLGANSYHTYLRF